MVRGVFFCNLEGHFKSDCTQFWDAVADAKHPRHDEALSGVKASRARLMNEAESRRKETTWSTFTTKKVKTWPDEGVASNLETESSSPLKVDYGLAARDSSAECQTRPSHERSGAMGKVRSWGAQIFGKVLMS